MVTNASRNVFGRAGSKAVGYRAQLLIDDPTRERERGRQRQANTEQDAAQAVAIVRLSRSKPRGDGPTELIIHHGTP